MTSYFKFLEWWLLLGSPHVTGTIPLSKATVELENALVGNIEKRYPNRCQGKYPFAWKNRYWDNIQWI